MFAFKEKEGRARDIQINDSLQSISVEKLHPYSHNAMAENFSTPI